MRVVTLKANQELPQKDFMSLDMIYLHKGPNEAALKFEMTKYQGGLDNQTNQTLTLEVGSYIDSFKLKSGENAEGLDTKDYIVRRIVAGKHAEKTRVTLRDQNDLANRSSASSGYGLLTETLMKSFDL